MKESIILRTLTRNPTSGKSSHAERATLPIALLIREGTQAMTARGTNYWESKDGKDRRLIFAMNDYLQEVNAATGQPIYEFGKDGVVDLREGESGGLRRPSRQRISKRSQQRSQRSQRNIQLVFRMNLAFPFSSSAPLLRFEIR